MTQQNDSSAVTKFIILVNGIIAGWDFRQSLINFSNGEPLWGIIFLILALLLVFVASALLVFNG